MSQRITANPKIGPGGRAFKRIGELVDFDDYLPFMPDDPDLVPIYVDTKLPLSQREWMYQHVYFMRNFYGLLGPPFRQLSESPHSQLTMQREEEQKVHAVFVRHVHPPSEGVAIDALTDLNHLDILGAAALGREVSINPDWSPGHFESPVLTSAPRILTDEAVGFYDAQIEEALAALEHPLVTPEKIITSAIRRLGILLGNERLLRESVERSPDGIFYPLRTQRLSWLGAKAIKSLVESANQNRQEALQTGVNEVKLVA